MTLALLKRRDVVLWHRRPDLRPDQRRALAGVS
jgi:hypothetical protein